MPEKFKLELDQNQINILIAGLNELPRKISEPLVQQISNQIQSQIQTEEKKD